MRTLSFTPLLVLALAFAGCSEDPLTANSTPAVASLEIGGAGSKGGGTGCTPTPGGSDSYSGTTGGFEYAGSVTAGFGCGIIVSISASSEYTNGANQNTGCTTHSVSADIYQNGAFVGTVSDASSNKAVAAALGSDLYPEFEDVIQVDFTHYWAPSNPTCSSTTLSQVVYETITIDVVP